MRCFKRILCYVLCLSFVFSSAVPSLAMGFTEDTTNGGVHYTEETRYQVYDGVVYDMYWGIPDSIVKSYKLDTIERNQNYKYWAVFCSPNTDQAGFNAYPRHVVEFNYDGSYVPTNVSNTTSSDGSLYTYAKVYQYMIYCDYSCFHSISSSSKSRYSTYERILDSYDSYAGRPIMSNATFFNNAGIQLNSPVPSPDNADLGFEDAVIDPTDDWDDYFDDDGNLKPDDTDYGIFTPIVNFFKMILYRLKAIYAFIRTINIAIVNALRMVLTDPINSITTAIDGWQHFFDNFDINVTDKLKEWSEFFTGFDDKMETLFSDMLTGLGDKIVESIKGVFLPSDGFFDEKVDFLKNKIAVTFGVSAYDMSHIFSAERSFTDFKANMYGKELTIIDMSYVVDALGTVRPIIRGFITLCLVFYNINQFLAFIGQPAISLGNMIKSVASSN